MAVLSDNEINDKLKSFNGWSLNNNQIEKEFELKDFSAALDAVNKIGVKAEEMNHHPDLLIHSYNKLKITVSTHSEGGVTEKDFKLAEFIESLNL
jgi:4a-hydroxytetrahydrobiopterin dehydratase